MQQYEIPEDTCCFLSFCRTTRYYCRAAQDGARNEAALISALLKKEAAMEEEEEHQGQGQAEEEGVVNGDGPEEEAEEDQGEDE